MSCDCDSQQGYMLPFDDALKRLLCSAKKVSHETILINQAFGRVLAQDITSPVNVPPHNNSAMDGYALKSEDLTNSDTLEQVGYSFAGQPFNGELSSGQCIRIMTGAVIPKGANCVIMQENTQATEKQITFIKPAASGANIRNIGEDIKCDALVLQTGHKLVAADIGLLASLGIDKISVYKKVKVAVLSTGDELVEPGGSLKPGQIFESNRHTVTAMLRQLPVDIIDLGIVSDDLQILKDTFKHANEIADVVVSSGGVSVGEADYVKEILTQMGEINFWKIAIKPGKPFACGKLPNSYFIGLPGNPVSATVTFDQLAIPFIKTLSGEQITPRIQLNAVALDDFKKRPGRLEFQRGIASQNNKGEWQVNSTGKQGSGILSSLSRANCYVILPQASTGVLADEKVIIELFNQIA
ncbi:gephyrin-like molybdotransferase Glp [Pseudoalteromonas denitrificans]|uniref:Molybdopterin molybdenumtransferase n=1 Tax=Pseudoalteromonas denitrificans DSM 6059 TaxID=1123010 RepID=A0A1I1FBG0_9GAMM|nr:gephyrin-like molybdotransferase Glp [Pseudoalteromonas denitrificans]SFB96266.1 molybdopterin molybdochelatase [Pseudoalteromonas denitrificans DSM 6059]